MGDLIPVEYRAERVLTTEQLSQAYECEPNNIKKNFNSNKEHFEEGRHYYKVEGDALNDLRVTFSDLQISPKTRCLYLWTRRGASRHSKMLGTDKAWEMFDALEENYFNPRPKALTPAEQMAQGLLYSKYQAKGYTHSETVDITHSDGRADVVMNTKWTQKGRLFLYQHLKKHGILPVIEQNQQPVLTIVG